MRRKEGWEVGGGCVSEGEKSLGGGGGGGKRGGGGGGGRKKKKGGERLGKEEKITGGEEERRRGRGAVGDVVAVGWRVEKGDRDPSTAGLDM